MPDGKILSINNRLYNNGGYMPDYNSIQYQASTMIAQTTTIPSANTNFIFNLPQAFSTYHHIILIIQAQASQYKQSSVSLTINGNYLSDSNDSIYTTSITTWWLFGIQFNNLFLCTTHKSTSTGMSIVVDNNNYIIIKCNTGGSALSMFNVYFGIY